MRELVQHAHFGEREFVPRCPPERADAASVEAVELADCFGALHRFDAWIPVAKETEMKVRQLVDFVNYHVGDSSERRVYSLWVSRTPRNGA